VSVPIRERLMINQGDTPMTMARAHVVGLGLGFVRRWGDRRRHLTCG
jgi:hypothetical protein